jgi:hypothetical protein
VKSDNRGGSFGRKYLWWTQRLRARGAGVLARDVLDVLASYADKYTGEAYPSIATIAEILGVTEHAVKMAVRELKSAGIVAVTVRNRRKGESNLYHLAIFGSPFYVTESATYKRDYQVSDPVTCSSGEDDAIRLPKTHGSGYQNGHLSSCALSTKIANNLPVEPTREPSVLCTAPTRSRSRRKNDSQNGTAASTIPAKAIA